MQVLPQTLLKFEIFEIFESCKNFFWPIEIMVLESCVLIIKAQAWSPISKMVRNSPIGPRGAELRAQNSQGVSKYPQRGHIAIKKFLLALALCKLNGKVPQVVGFLQLNPGPPSAKTLGAIPKYVSTFGLHKSLQIAKKIWPIEIMLWELSVLMKKAPIWCPISKKVQFPKIWPLLAELWSQHFFSCPDGSHCGNSRDALWLPCEVLVLFPCS